MVPYSERRHRLNPLEINPVKEAVHDKLVQLLKTRDPDALLFTSILFRVWYRIEAHVKNKPRYPLHETYDQIATYMKYGTETPPIEQTIEAIAEDSF